MSSRSQSTAPEGSCWPSTWWAATWKTTRGLPWELAGTIDLRELIDGYSDLSNAETVEVIVAFGGADKDGWRGMKLANIDQLSADEWDGEFGNETGPDAYLYQADGAHMGDESSLKLFLDYLRDGYVNFDLRFLTFWDHGNSYKGFGNDSNFNRDALSMDEIAGAFQRSQPGRFDLVGFDACFMASIEVARFIEPYARYMIASEELEPGHGWLWSAVIEHYTQEDSIVEAGRKMVDNFVQDVHEYKADGKTLSLLDLGQYHQLVAVLDPVIAAYGAEIRSDDDYSDSLNHGSTKVRSYSEPRTGKRLYIDLKHFAQLLAENSPDEDTSVKLDRLMDAIDRFVDHSAHDGTRPNSFGVTIDAPENTESHYDNYKVSDTWVDFQHSYEAWTQDDTTAPLLVAWDDDADPQSLQFDADVPGAVGIRDWRLHSRMTTWPGSPCCTDSWSKLSSTTDRLTIISWSSLNWKHIPPRQKASTSYRSGISTGSR